MNELFHTEKTCSVEGAPYYRELRYCRHGHLLPIDFLFYADSTWGKNYHLNRRSTLISLTRINSGDFMLTHEQQHHHCLPGSFLLVRENVFASWSVTSPRVQREILLFPPEGINGLLFSTLFPLPVTLIPPAAEKTRLFSELVIALKEGNISNFQLNAMTWQLLMQLSPQHNRDEHFPPELYDALDYMEQNFSRDPSLQSVADKANISLRSLSRLFSQYLDISPARYLNSLRMERARTLLLLHPGKNVKEIAYELNFSSPALFSESFRKFYGAPPHSYRSHGGEPGPRAEKSQQNRTKT